MSDKTLVSRLRDVLELVTTIVMLVAALAFLWTTLIRGSRTPLAGASIPVPPEPMSLGGAPVMGSAGAKIALIAFSDFQCSFCAEFAENTLPEIKAKYVDTGKMMFVFRHNPLSQVHPRAEPAAQASECAAQQGKFWELHDRLFKDPRKLEEPVVLGYAANAGLDVKAFQTCLAGPSTERVRLDTEMAKKLKLTGTPTFFVGRVIAGGRVEVRQVLTGARPMAEFSAAIDELLAAVER